MNRECQLRMVGLESGCRVWKISILQRVMFAGFILIVAIRGDADQTLIPSESSVADTLPVLGESRLFMSAEQRMYLDSRAPVEPEPSDQPEVEAVMELEEVEKIPAVKEEKRKVRTTRLDGHVVRSDGAADVWVNGALINKKSDLEIKVFSVPSTGPVVLGIDDRRYRLYPGQVVRNWTAPPRPKKDGSL